MLAMYIIIKPQQNKTFTNILNQYMKGLSSLAINVITKQQQNKIYQSITIHNIRVKGKLKCDVTETNLHKSLPFWYSLNGFWLFIK